MKWIVVVLVLLNVAAYLFGQKLSPGEGQYDDSGQFETVNAEAMTVVPPGRDSGEDSSTGESDGLALEEDNLAQLKVDKRGQVLMAPKVETDDAMSEPLPVIVSKEPLAKQASSPPSPPPTEEVRMEDPRPDVSVTSKESVLSCYRLGPFKDQKSLASIRRDLESQGVQYLVNENRAQQNIKAVRVYLGAYSDSDRLDAEKKRLEDMGIEHFVIRLNSTPLIQLGYFSEPARATAYQNTLKARGVEAKTEAVYHDAKIDSWLEVSRASQDQVDSLKLPRGISVSKRACK